MRVVLATYTGAGHVLPLARLADLLRAAGHEAELLSADLRAGGRRFATVPPPPPGRFEDNVAAYGDVLFGEAMATEVRDVARSVAADVVVADALAPAALCGAHASGAAAVVALNLPYGRLRKELAAGTGWWASRLGALVTVRRSLGLDPYAHALDSWERCERMLLLGIPELEPPHTTPPGHLRFVGPCLPLPEDPAPGDGSPPRVVVSLSSSDMGHERVLQAVLSALGDLDVTVVASTAGVVDATRLDLPANVEVHDWLPLPDALAGAAAAVTHGGHGTVMAALAAGVPLVCVPLGRDQPSTAARLEALGAGRTASPDTVGAAVVTTVTDQGQRAAALRLRARLAALADAPATALDGLARTTT